MYQHGKQRPITRSLSRRPTGVSETSELFSYKSNGNLQTSISPESELDIISHTFENNFTDDNGQCENGISHTETISESLEPSLENNGVIFNERNATGRTNNVTTDFNLYCYSSCEFGRKYDRSMLQCSTCMQWFHTICANVDAKHKNIWNCERCRSIPVVIDSLINQMSEVHTILSQMVEKQNFLCDQFCTLQNKNTKLEDEIKILKQENYKLRIRSYNRFIHSNSSDSSETDSDSESEDHGTQSFSKLQDHHTDTKLYNNNHDSDVEIVDMSPPVTENQSKKTPKSTCHDTKKPKLTVLGNSIVRNTGPVLSAALPNFDTMVYSTSGLGLQQAKEQAGRIFLNIMLQTLHYYKLEHVMQIYFQRMNLYQNTFLLLTLSDTSLPKPKLSLQLCHIDLVVSTKPQMLKLTSLMNICVHSVMKLMVFCSWMPIHLELLPIIIQMAYISTLMVLHFLDIILASIFYLVQIFQNHNLV